MGAHAGKIYWGATVLFALALGGSAAMNLISHPEIMKSMASLNFPEWFPPYLGAWKAAGVIVLLAPGLPRLKEWATAGFTVSLVSASAAHIFNGDPIATAVPPLVLLSLCLVSWAFRPASRRLSIPK